MARTIHERLYSFGEAASASGVPPKAIRNWLDRDQVRLSANETREGLRWRRFSVFDVLRLALTKRLVDFCLPVEAASLYADGSLPATSSVYEQQPPGELAADLKYTKILLWRDGGGWDGRYHRLPDPIDYDSLPDSVVTVHVGRVAAQVIAALAEIDQALGDDVSDE